MRALEGKGRAFIKKVNSRCFCWFPAAILVDQNGTPIWRLHTKLYKGAWNVSANNSETVGHKDLQFGQIVYILVFYNISFSWLLPQDGFQFIFMCRVYCVTVKMKNTMYLLKIKNKLKIGKNSWYFVDIFNKTITSLAPVGYGMAICHLISNAHLWNNF